MTSKYLYLNTKSLVIQMKPNDKSIEHTIKQIKKMLKTNLQTEWIPKHFHYLVLIYKYNDLLHVLKHDYNIDSLESEFQTEMELSSKEETKKYIISSSINALNQSAMNYFRLRALKGHKYVALNKNSKVTLPQQSNFDLLLHNLLLDSKKNM